MASRAAIPRPRGGGRGEGKKHRWPKGRKYPRQAKKHGRRAGRPKAAARVAQAAHSKRAKLIETSPTNVRPTGVAERQRGGRYGAGAPIGRTPYEAVNGARRPEAYTNGAPTRAAASTNAQTAWQAKEPDNTTGQHDSGSGRAASAQRASPRPRGGRGRPTADVPPNGGEPTPKGQSAVGGRGKGAREAEGRPKERSDEGRREGRRRNDAEGSEARPRRSGAEQETPPEAPRPQTHQGARRGSERSERQPGN